MATYEDLGNETIRVYGMEGFKIKSLLWDIERHMREVYLGKSTLVSESGFLPNDYRAEHHYLGATVNVQTHQGKQHPEKTNIDLVVASDDADKRFAVLDNLGLKLARLELYFERNPSES